MGEKPSMYPPQIFFKIMEKTNITHLACKSTPIIENLHPDKPLSNAHRIRMLWCEDHKIKVCFCGWEWLDHKPLYSVEQQKTFIKNTCWCGNSIPGTWEYYQVRGNYCAECNVRAEQMVKMRGKRIKEMIKLKNHELLRKTSSIL